MTTEARRWRHELAEPQPTQPIYLTTTAIDALKYALSHCTKDDPTVTLSEAVTRLANEWVRHAANQDLRDGREDAF